MAYQIMYDIATSINALKPLFFDVFILFNRKFDFL